MSDYTTLMKVRIPADVLVSFSYVKVPMETPFGIMQTWAMEVCFSGRVFHCFETGNPDGSRDALDVASGECVTLVYEGHT